MSIAMAMLIAAAGVSASAQNDGKRRSHQKARKECARATEARKDVCIDPERKCLAKADKKCAADCLLEGITLSPEQQAKVDAMKQKQKAEFDKKMKERKEKQMKKAEKQRQKAEKERAKNQKKLEKRMEKMEKEMKEILTPEQYLQFRQNVDKAKAERKNRSFDNKGRNKHHKDGKGRKHHKCDGKGRNCSADRPGESTVK